HGIPRLLPDTRRDAHVHGGRDQEGVPPPGAQVSSGCEQGGERRAEIQGSAGGVRGPEGPREARRLRSARQRVEVRPAVPATSGGGGGLRVPGGGAWRRLPPVVRGRGRIQRVLLLTVRRRIAFRRRRRYPSGAQPRRPRSSRANRPGSGGSLSGWHTHAGL